MNDARLMHKFEVGSQSHDATLGFYVAMSRWTSAAIRLLPCSMCRTIPLLDLVAVDPAANVVGTLTDHGIYHYGTNGPTTRDSRPPPLLPLG